MATTSVEVSGADTYGSGGPSSLPASGDGSLLRERGLMTDVEVSVGIAPDQTFPGKQKHYPVGRYLPIHPPSIST